jgi:hypothetical protein
MGTCVPTKRCSKKIIIPIFKYDASLHDLQGLARFTQGKCAISPSIAATIINKLRGRMNKKQYLGEKIKMSDFEKIIRGALLNFVKM